MSDPVNHPPHYNEGPCCEHCGKPIECIVVVEIMGFNLGNVVKYLWRMGKKGPPLEDLKKGAVVSRPGDRQHREGAA